DRLRKRFSIRQHQPLAMLLDQRSHKLLLRPLEDLNDPSLIKSLALLAPARVGDLGRNHIAIDRAALFSGRNIEVLMTGWIARLDKAKALAIVPIHPHDRPRALLLRGQYHRPAAAQHHPSLTHQITKH